MRQLLAGALYGDHLPSGAFCVTVPHVHCLTHLGQVAFPPGETFGPTFPRCTEVEGFRFAGQAHDTTNPAAWEYDPAAGGWVSYAPPCCGVSAVIYDLDGVLHRSDCSVGTQGYRYVNEQNQIISGDATYRIDLGGGRLLFEYTDVGGLLIGQAAYDGGGVQVWDGETLRQLELGDCRFIRANRDGDVVALAFTKPEGVVLLTTTMAELRALPPVVPPTPEPEPPDPTPVPPDPEPTPEPPDPGPGPEPPHPQPPEEPPMIAYALPVPGFLPGDLIDNGNGTVSVRKPNGNILCVTPPGGIEERGPDQAGGVWESFVRAKNGASLLAWRELNGAQVVYTLPLVE